jgi:hypothetical protein
MVLAGIGSEKEPPMEYMPCSWELMAEHLIRHRERCGVGPALVLRCECGTVEVLVCSRCHSALMAVTRGSPLCEHGQLLVEGGLAA